MRKSLAIIFIIVILGGLGYFAYSKDLINFDFLKKGEVVQDQESVELNNEVAEESEEFSDVGESIQGDFNGDGKKEIARVVAIEDGMDGIYEIQFLDKNISSIRVDGDVWRPYLVYQGDLNNDGFDDIALQSQTEDRKMRFYYFSKSNWIEFFPKFYVAFDDTVSINNHEFRFVVEKNNVTRSDSFELIISKDGEKIQNDYLFLDSEIVDFLDVNNDGYRDIKLTESNNYDTCAKNYNPAQYYLFDPKINSFRKINTKFNSWYMSKLHSDYYMEREYNPCKGVSKYYLFKLENYEPVYKGYIDFGYNDEKGNDNLHYKDGKQVVYIYKGSTLIETLFVDEGTYSGSTKYIKSSQSYYFDEEKYFNENYKKFE